MSKFKDLWQELGGLSNRVDRLESQVRAVWRRPRAKGRETPFFGEKQFVLQPGQTEPQESPLVHSAGSVTRVTRLTYAVRALVTQSGVDAYASMRQTPQGMFYTQPTPAPQIGFDFEWTYTVGSTERKYSTANPSPDGWNWLSRFSFGNPESAGNLLFNPKHPLILTTNQFLTFRIRPIYWLNATNPVSVNISYAGTRTFGYEV